MNTGIQKFAALYCRLSRSDETQLESNSIANQKIIVTKTAQAYGYEHTQFFVDNGYSGTLFERPALKRMEEAIQAGIVSAVIVKDVSRLGRDYLRVGQYIEQFFPQHNVRFIAASGGIDSNDNSVDFLPLHSVMDEWYARDISRKLRSMYQARAHKGEPIGAPVYGYMRSAGNPKHWEPDPKTAPIVQEIYYYALMGYGTSQIAQWLEAQRVLTPSIHRIAQSGNGGGLHGNKPYRWNASTVAQILGRQEYCGDVLNLKTYSNSIKDKRRRLSPPNKVVVLRDVHEPIIERSAWEYIQNKRSAKQRRKAGKQSLFSGFLKCADCGSNMHFHFNQKNPSIEYYNCSNYVGNRGTCPSTHYVRLDFLTARVSQEMNHLLEMAHQDWARFESRLHRQGAIASKERADVMNREYRSLVARQGKLESLLAKSYESSVCGLIDHDTFASLAATFKKEQGTIKKKCQMLVESIQRQQYMQESTERFLKVLGATDAFTSLTRELLHQLVDWIAVYPVDRSGSAPSQKIEIHYHYIGRVDTLL